MSITTKQRLAIQRLAGGCCEYCRVAPEDRLSKFQVDHIIPIKHGGDNDTPNLCLACLKCNGFKGPNVAALDPATGDATKLYNPRRQQWADHFHLNPDATITGISPEGRATVIVLRINEPGRVKHRQMAMLLDEYPCKKK